MILSLLIIGSTLSAQDVTGLSDWSLFVDPGHSIKQNMGVNGYSEAESNLKMALHVKDLFQTHTDIGNLWTSRTNNTEEVGLYTRSVMANNLNADWFHSIHSNAAGASANNVLLLYGELHPGVEKTPNGGKAISQIMAPLMAGVMRIPEFRGPGQGDQGDCVFYGIQNGPYLSVNRNTTMPSQLSESGFHTNPGQNNLQMNYEYARLVAHSIFWTFLDHFEFTRPYPGILAGVVSDSESGLAINGATIQVNGESYTTDTYASLFNKYSSDPEKLRNGFYYFEGLPDQAHEVVVSAPGYYSDTLQVSDMNDAFITFLNVELTSDKPPYVEVSYPANGAYAFPSWNPLKFRFNRPMNTTTVENAFSLDSVHTGTFEWNTAQTIMTFISDDTLGFERLYTVTIAGTATDSYDHPIDGNGDGTGGDDWFIQFTTGQADMDPPEIVLTYPENYQQEIGQKPVLTVLYNEHLLPESFSTEKFVVARLANGQEVSAVAEMEYVGQQTVVSVFPLEELIADESYQLRLYPGLKDLHDHEITYTRYINFKTALIRHSTTSIDDFNGSFTSYWWQALGSGSTSGIIGDGTHMSVDTAHSILNVASTTSMQIDYQWDPDVSAWLIRHHLDGGPATQVKFDESYKLEAFVYGDASGNTFRFAVRESDGSIEVSPWYTVDWLGWRLVSWDMANDGTGSWIGDGTFATPMYVESLQFSHETDAGLSGTLYIDDLRLATINTTSTDFDQEQLPSRFAILPNYPNPFNPVTTIPFQLPEAADVRLSVYNMKGALVETVFQGKLDAGQHVTRWDASSQSTGIYLLVMETGQNTTSRKITVLK